MNAIECCPDCDESIQWRCNSCEKKNEKSIHIHYIHEKNNS
jgi:predicted RNA-binding Zn-ribbon protein involved in translation (DUF1610 family)